MGIRFWIARIPDHIWAPVWEAVLILIVGITAWAAGQPWLFASLGPTAYEQAEKPHMNSARLYNVLVGHFVALGCGFLGVAIMSAWGAPKVNATTFISMARLGASVIAVAVTTLLCLKLKASQPAALATTLLVTLGPYDTARGALWIAAGVVIIAAVGEPVRRMRLSRPQSQ